MTTPSPPSRAGALVVVGTLVALAGCGTPDATFNTDAYRHVLLEPVARLDALAADERAAKARHRRQVPRRHTRRWFTRLRGGE